jgi:hypothetical protein
MRGAGFNQEAGSFVIDQLSKSGIGERDYRDTRGECLRDDSWSGVYGCGGYDNKVQLCEDRCDVVAPTGKFNGKTLCKSSYLFLVGGIGKKGCSADYELAIQDRAAKDSGCAQEHVLAFFGRDPADDADPNRVTTRPAIVPIATNPVIDNCDVGRGNPPSQRSRDKGRGSYDLSIGDSQRYRGGPFQIARCKIAVAMEKDPGPSGRERGCGHQPRTIYVDQIDVSSYTTAGDLTSGGLNVTKK